MAVTEFLPENLRQSVFLVKFRPLPLLAMTEFVADFVTESVFSLMLRRSLFLVKLQVFTVNSNE